MSHGNNCVECINCHQACTACAAGCRKDQIYLANMRRINRQVGMSASQATMMRGAARVSQIVGQGAHKTNLGQAGGPGDYVHSQTPSLKASNAARSVRYRVPILRTRTAYRGKKGVDKKHGSYDRFLARRVGGVLRKEQMPNVVAKTAVIKQPRNRTGTNSGVTSTSRMSTQYNNCLFGSARSQANRYFTLFGGPVIKHVETGFKDKITTYDKTRNIDPKDEPCPGNFGGLDTNEDRNGCFSENCCLNRINKPKRTIFNLIPTVPNCCEVPSGTGGAHGGSHCSCCPKWIKKPTPTRPPQNTTVQIEVETIEVNTPQIPINVSN